MQGCLTERLKCDLVIATVSHCRGESFLQFEAAAVFPCYHKREPDLDCVRLARDRTPEVRRCDPEMLPDRPETRPGEPEIRSGRPGGVGVATWGTPDREFPAPLRVCIFRVFCEVPIGRPVERKSAVPFRGRWRRAGVFFCPVGGAATASSASEKRISAVGRMRFMAPAFGVGFLSISD